MSSYTTSWTFLSGGSLVSGDLSISSVISNEIDTGNFSSFTDSAPDPFPISGFGLFGMEWGGFQASVSDPGSSSSFTITCNVDVTDPTQVITSLRQFYLVDSLVGPGVSASATEQAFDSFGNLVGTMTWSSAGGATSTVSFATGYQHLSIVVTVNEAVDALAPAGSQIGISTIDYNFGQTALSQMAVIGNNVFLDTGDTGAQTGVDAGPGVPGVTVELLQNVGGTFTQVATTTTDANGLYQFITNPGVYEVEFVPPTGYTFSPQDQSGVDLSSTADQTTGITQAVTVAAGDTINWLDAGLVPPTTNQNGTASIGDNVFLDIDGSGVQSGVNAGPGVANVTVNLLHFDAGTYTQVQITTTDSNGLYSFDSLVAGTYEVQFVAPVGYDFSIQNANPNPDLASSPDSVTGITAPIVLHQGDAVTSVDAGLVAPKASIALDKQISADGINWVDVGNGNLAQNPSVLVGSMVYERVIAINTGAVAISGAQVTDVGGNGPAGFNFGGSGTFALEIGQTLASDVATITAGANLELDTATVSGTATDILGTTTPVTATDQANYTGVTPGIALDKQISTDGINWVDVGNGNLAQNPSVLVGSKVYERVIAINTGALAISGAQVIDVGGNGPAGFNFGGSGNFALGVGGTITSDVATIIAGANLELDTATVAGTASDSFGHSAPVTATDQANYTGVTPGIALDKQISADGINWVDVGNGNLAQNPSVLVGSKVYERVIAVNTGAVAISGAHVSDVGGNGPAGFNFGGSGTFVLGAGGTITSDVATITAGANLELDTATVTGTANDSFGHSAPVNATDQANYTGVTPGIALDKQISTDGTNWVDVGNGNLAQNPSVNVGSKVYERVIVSNTGALAITGAQVTDVGGNGPAGFNFGGSGTFNLAVGGNITSDVATITAGSGYELDTATVGGTASDAYGHSTTVSATDQANYNGSGPGITVVKLPCQVVVGTCGQVSYTYLVKDTGNTPLTNIQITDNIGTAAKPNYITPVAVTSGGFNIGDANHNGVLDTGETWQFSNTINQSGDYTCGRSSSVCHTVSGTHLSSGCTAWLNSSFTPASCRDGATYTFQNLSCTISGPGCPTTTVQVPNACVTFSRNCTQASTSYDGTQNCWVTTLPANCSPGSVFLSGLPFQVPSGCNLSGATVTWNCQQSANNCGASNVSWDAGCTGYSNFGQNGCDGQDDYNQIGVKVCDNSASYGCGGSTSQGYGWNYGDSGGYCGGYWGGGWGGYGSGWSGCGSDWGGSSNDCAGTPENQYTGSNCDYGSYGSYGSYGCYGGFGGYGWGYGSGDDGGVCGNGGGSGSICQGQLGDSPQADTVTVTATTLGNGFSLGDAANYGIIAFAPYTLKGSSNSPINGSVGIGVSCGSTVVQLGGDKITGNLVSTGSKPTSTGGTVTGTISGNSATLSADISALQALSMTLGSETGTSVSLSSGMVLNATSGVLDSAGDYVFTIVNWANNITIKGDGTHHVVLNIASSVTPILDNVTLTGGLTENQVLFNDQYVDTIAGTSGTTFHGTFLAPNATFSVTGTTVDGHLFGGGSGKTFSFTSGATLNTPANTGDAAPAVTTVSASDSKEVQVLSSSSPISLNGTTPTGSLSALYGTGAKVEFAYNPSNTVSLKQIQAGLATATGSNSNSMAFIEITNNTNPFAANASIYFEGEVVTGEKIFADATINQLTNTLTAAPNNHFSTVAGSDIYAYVFNSQADFQGHASPIQTLAYNTSGSQAMHFGDQIGSLTVIGYVGSNGGHLVS